VETRILIVDDDAAIRTLLVALCRRLKYESDVAADGVEALEKISGGHFDLVLLDLMMPRMNGYQVIDALRSIASRPPVIVLTAHGDTRSAAANVEVVHAVLRKPFDVATLIGIMSDVLAGMTSVRDALEPTP
jgi:CheY-like chemotaxis protein